MSDPRTTRRGNLRQIRTFLPLLSDTLLSVSATTSPGLLLSCDRAAVALDAVVVALAVIAVVDLSVGDVAVAVGVRVAVGRLDDAIAGVRQRNFQRVRRSRTFTVCQSGFRYGTVLRLCGGCFRRILRRFCFFVRRYIEIMAKLSLRCRHVRPPLRVVGDLGDFGR